MDNVSSLFLQYNVDATSVTIVISLCITLVIFTWIVCRLFRGSKGNYVLFIGCEDVGKTHIFACLTGGTQSGKTVTSIKENLALLDGQERYFIVDIPGNQRITWRVFEQVKNKAAALMFVADSATFKNQSELADVVYRVLCDRYIQKSRIPIALICNKQDMPLAKSPTLVLHSLEKEIQTVRQSSQRSLDNVVLTLDIPVNQEFSFEALKNPFTLCGASAIKNEVAEVTTFLSKL